MKIERLSIDRARWGKSALRNDDGTMCCLGFLGVACGVPESEMLEVGMPNDIVGMKYRSKYPIDVFADDDRDTESDFADEAASINDSGIIKPYRKEEKLKKLFKTVGIKLTFRGKRKSKGKTK